MITFSQLEEERRKANEINDCSVKMIASALDITYTQSHNYLSSLGRKPRKGANIYDILNDLKDKGVKFQEVTSQIRRYAKTAKSLKNLNLRGKNLIVLTSKHAFNVKNGNIIDWSENRQLRILQVWEITHIPFMQWDDSEIKPIVSRKQEDFKYGYIYKGEIIKKFKRKPKNPVNRYISRDRSSLGKIQTIDLKNKMIVEY